MEQVTIDVRDVDYTWFEHVEAYINRDLDLYHFPRHSVERLGEILPDGDAELIDGRVSAKGESIDVSGQLVDVWTVSIASLLTRPAAQRMH